MRLNSAGRRVASLVCGIAVFAMEQTAFGAMIEDFDSPSGPDGQVLFDAAPVYDGIEDGEALGVVGGDNDGSATNLNGYIESSFGTDILNDQSGTGFYLHHRTLGGPDDYAAEVWGTISAVSVIPSTVYELSFYFTAVPTLIEQIQLVTRFATVGVGVSVRK